MKLVLLGAPGAGKGTQAAFLKDKYGLVHISTGDILRQNIKEGTPLGKKARVYMEAGDLVPNEVVMNMIKVKLTSLPAEQGFMLDGFPRTVEQAKFLETITPLDAVLLFEVSDDDIVHRLMNRAVCSSCGTISTIANGKCPSCGGELYRRADDNEGTIRSRLKVFHDQTEPLIEFYRERKLLHEVDATGKPEEIFMRVLSLLKS